MPAAIRRATAQDIPRLAQLLAKLFAIESDFTADTERQVRGLTRLLASDAAVLVAESQGRVVGMVTVQYVISTAEGGRAAWLEDMVIDSTHRGCGIGQALLTEACRAAAERGCTRIQLVADEDNTQALGFYRHHGWRETRLRTWRRRLTAAVTRGREDSE